VKGAAVERESEQHDVGGHRTGDRDPDQEGAVRAAFEVAALHPWYGWAG